MNVKLKLLLLLLLNLLMFLRCLETSCERYVKNMHWNTVFTGPLQMGHLKLRTKHQETQQHWVCPLIHYSYNKYYWWMLLFIAMFYINRNSTYGFSCWWNVGFLGNQNLVEDSQYLASNLSAYTDLHLHQVQAAETLPSCNKKLPKRKIVNF